MQIEEPIALSQPRPEPPPFFARQSCDQLLLIHQPDVVGKSSNRGTNLFDNLVGFLVEVDAILQCVAHRGDQCLSEEVFDEWRIVR